MLITNTGNWGKSWSEFLYCLWHVGNIVFNSFWSSDTNMVTEIWVNIGSGNGLVPDSTKPLSEPILTDHRWSPVTFILRQFHNHLRVPDLQMSCRHLITWQSTRRVALSMTAGWHAPLYHTASCQPAFSIPSVLVSIHIDCQVGTHSTPTCHAAVI